MAITLSPEDFSTALDFASALADAIRTYARQSVRTAVDEGLIFESDGYAGSEFATLNDLLGRAVLTMDEEEFQRYLSTEWATAICPEAVLRDSKLLLARRKELLMTRINTEVMNMPRSVHNMPPYPDYLPEEEEVEEGSDTNLLNCCLANVLACMNEPHLRIVLDAFKQHVDYMAGEEGEEIPEKLF